MCVLRWICCWLLWVLRVPLGYLAQVSHEVAQLSATEPIASQDCSSLPGVKGGRSPLRSNASAPLMPGGGVQTLGIGAGAGGAMNSKQTSDLYAIQSSFFCMSPRTGCLLTGCNPESKESRQCRTRST